MKYNIETELGAVAQLIERGEMVALRGINTYLVCSALNEESISKALKIKGKHDNPLILYTASLNMANEYIRNISHEAYVTAKKLWPSSTIFILPAKKTIPSVITYNLDAAFACPTEKVLRQISCLINSPLVLIKVPSEAPEEQNYDIAVVDCDLPFIRKPPIIFDGRDELHRIETENPDFFAVP